MSCLVWRKRRLSRKPLPEDGRLAASWPEYLPAAPAHPPTPPPAISPRPTCLALEACAFSLWPLAFHTPSPPCLCSPSPKGNPPPSLQTPLLGSHLDLRARPRTHTHTHTPAQWPPRGPCPRSPWEVVAPALPGLIPCWLALGPLRLRSHHRAAALWLDPPSRPGYGPGPQ